MKEYEEHLKKYQYNKDALRSGQNTHRIDCAHWEVVAEYYACVHLIEAVLHREFDEEIVRHEERAEKMLTYKAVFRRCIPCYRSLSTLAHTARYKDCDLIDDGDVKKAREYLKKIERELKRYIT